MLRVLFFHLHSVVLASLPWLALLSVGFMIVSQSGYSDLHAYIAAGIITVLLFSLLRLSGIKNTPPQFLAPLIVRVLSVRLSVWPLVIAGICLRLIWFVVFDVQQVSDYSTYTLLANKLITGAPYEIAGTKAYWPVGYPAFLAGAHLGHFPVTAFSIFLLNILLYLLSSYFIYHIAKRLFNTETAVLALVIVTFWPSNFAMVGMAFKEYLVYTLLAASIYLYLTKTHYLYFVISGVLLGCSALVQPGTLLFASVFIVAAWVAAKPVKRQLLQILTIVIGMVIAIAPWTYRNYHTFDQVVLISSNGGSNFFRANNDLAHGGYLEYFLDDVEALSEAEKDQAYKALAIDWIKQNPGKFLSLSLRKVMLFLGDDSTGFYLSLKQAALQPVSNTAYLLAKLSANMFWLLLWLLLLLRVKHFNALVKQQPELLTLTLGFMYFLTIHAVFESNAKYHFPASWMLAIMAAAALSMLAKSARDAQLSSSKDDE